jgi:hypothetical protein
MRIKVQELTKFLQDIAVRMNKLFAVSVEDSHSSERARTWLGLHFMFNLLNLWHGVGALS